MLQAIRSDVRLYLRMIAMQVHAQCQYKLNLLVDIVTYFAVTVVELAAILLYFGAFPTLLGWHIGEVVFLASIMSFCFGISEVLGAGIDNFAETIKRGEFDRVLLRPAGAFMQIVGSDFRLRRLGRMTQGLFGLMIALRLLPGLHWTMEKIVVLCLGIASGSVIFVSILLLGATVCFWTIETTELTNILTYGSREMLSYPLTVYNQGLQRFFLFVVPVAFGSYVPSCYVLEKSLPFGLSPDIAFASPLAALVFALVSSWVWNFGVRHYQSSGS